MATAQFDTPQFDLSTAVPETDDGKAISALPAFDLASAVPEDSISEAHPENNLPEDQASPLRQEAYDKMKAGIEQIPPSPVSEAVRGFIKNIGGGGVEQFKEANFDYTHAANIPTQNEGESDQDFNKRFEEFRQPLENKEIAKGAMGQLNDTFTAAIAIAAPEMSPKAWATLGTFMLGDTTRRAVQNILLPDLTPSVKDVLDIASFPIEGGLSHEAVTGIGDMISKAFTIKGLSPTIDLQPDLLKLFAEPEVTERPTPFVKASQEGWPAPDVETPTGVMSGGILDKLGISQNHFDVSQATGMPVRIPISKILEVSQDDKFDDFAKAMMETEGGGQEQGLDNPESPEEIALQKSEQVNMENEGGINADQGGEGAQSGSGEKKSEGQAETGLHLRDDAQGGMETEGGKELGADTNKGTSKIAQSIEQKSKDAGQTEGFDNLSEFDKTTFKEQREKGDKVISDLDNARAIIRGEKPKPEGVSGIAIIDAMERHLKTFPDGDLRDELAEELGNSKLVSETSTHAQETALAGMREPDSFTAKMNEINRAKVDAAGGDKEVSKATKKTLDTYKKESNKNNLSKDDLNWEKFLDGIKC